jgi:hypothetical protein
LRAALANDAKAAPSASLGDARPAASQSTSASEPHARVRARHRKERRLSPAFTAVMFTVLEGKRLRRVLGAELMTSFGSGIAA